MSARRKADPDNAPGDPKSPGAEVARRRNPLASEKGLAWLREELATAEHEARVGPDSTGWVYNETKRQEMIERAEFLRELVRGISEAVKHYSA